MDEQEIFDQENEEFIERKDIYEEVTFDNNDSSSNAMNEDYNYEGIIESEDHSEAIELIDNSIQGFFAHKDSVYSIDMHPIDQNIIVSGGGDDKGYLWRSDTGEQLYELSGHTDSVTSVKFSNNGEYVAGGGMDGKILVWEVNSGNLVTSLDSSDEIMWIDWHPKGAILLAGTNDGTVWMWQIPSGNCMNVFSGHAGSVTVGQFTPDGKKIVSGSNDCSIILWDPKTASSILKISGGEDSRFHQSDITSLAVNKESNLVLTGSLDCSSKLVNLNSGGMILGSFEDHTESIETVGFCNSHPLAATGSLDNKLNIWDLNTMRLRQTCQHDGGIIKLKWHNDSPLLTTCSDKTIHVWDSRTGNNEITWHGHQDSILDFAISNDGRKVVTASDDHVCLVFST
ncbi:hypothetical protein Glove_41g35 [Diversispora epigaea]|uniref:Uncharacterized protein n=1 Tax=Diversispora epigaea TaxID=1348612 RepID=A0A397JM37_9GLOM|nr:hypothetical protein Glove_41g35 [Diversispora epigaea]